MPIIFGASYFITSKLLINPSNITLDDIAKKILINLGNFSIIKGILVLFLTSFNIGFGLPLGRESPIAKLGGLLGEIFIKNIKVLRINTPLYLAIAVSSSIAATFNAPLAGIIFALEIVVGKINSYIVIPLIIASSTATLITRQFLGDFPAFFVPHLKYQNNFFYINLIEPIIFAIIAIIMLKSIKIFTILRITFRHKWKKIVIFNGFIVGILLAIFPQSAGVGYNFIDILFQNKFTPDETLIIGVIKIIIVTITIGSGLFGGLMSPSIFIGAFIGYFIGNISNDPRVFALIGSISMLSAISKAPLRSTIIIIELTHSYQLLIPSLISAGISSFIVAKFQEGSYFKRSLLQKGIDVDNPKIKKFLNSANLKNYISSNFALNVNSSLKKAAYYFKKQNIRYLPIIDDDKKLIGIISPKDIKKKKPIKECMSKNPIHLKTSHSADEILKILALVNSSYVPLTDENNMYLGLINIEKLIKDILIKS
jgi:CIC family chloride channel protein